MPAKPEVIGERQPWCARAPCLQRETAVGANIRHRLRALSLQCLVPTGEIGLPSCMADFEKEIAQKPAFVFGATSLPFPNGPPGNILALDETLPPEEAIRVIGVWLLRIHPDKFVIGVGPGEFYGADGLAATQVPHELSQLWWVIAVGDGLPRLINVASRRRLWRRPGKSARQVSEQPTNHNTSLGKTCGSRELCGLTNAR